MADTFSQLYIQIVFSVKDRKEPLNPNGKVNYINI